MSRFRRLAFVHAAMMAGEATLVVALADSFFFDVDLDAARSRILLFLLVSFAPFLVVAPLVGPFIDRLRGGRRLVIRIVAVARIGLQIVLALNIDSLLSFPLVFVILILQKTYVVSKSALVPSVVRTESELIEANSKLGLISGLTGTGAVAISLVVQVALGSTATLVYGVGYFAVAFVVASGLPREAVSPRRRRQRRPSVPAEVASAAGVTAILRGSSGFVLFQVAFWFRENGVSDVVFALAVASSALGTMAGNALAPRARRISAEEHLLIAALGILLLIGVIGSVLAVTAMAVVVTAVVAIAGAVARLAFESIVQRDASPLDRGRLFAVFETRFQFAWVAAGVVPVTIALPGPIGFAVVAALGAGGLIAFGGRLRRAVSAERG